MDYSNLTKKEVINGFKNKSIYLVQLSEEFKNDKEVVLEAVKQNGYSLEYASERLRNDKNVVLEAVKNCGYSLKFAAARLKNDKEIVLKAINQNGLALSFASEQLQNNRQLLEVLETAVMYSWLIQDKQWYVERMQVLNNMREKEFMEKNINLKNTKTKKIKF